MAIPKSCSFLSNVNIGTDPSFVEDADLGLFTTSVLMGFSLLPHELRNRSMEVIVNVKSNCFMVIYVNKPLPVFWIIFLLKSSMEILSKSPLMKILLLGVL